MKKICLFVLTLALLLGCVLPISVFAQSPIEISDAAGFAAMEADGNYILTQDIDFGNAEYENFIVGEFHGTLDGAGYALKNFSIAGGAKDSGVFQYLAATASGKTVIKNLSIGTKDAHIKMTLTGTASAHGVLSGAHDSYRSELSIENVHIFADVTAEMSSSMNFGGFLGASQNTSFKDCTMNGEINLKTTKADINAAGFSGMTKYAKGSLLNCKNYADITVEAVRTARAGGIICYASYGVDVVNCQNFGTVKNAYADAAPTHARFGGIVAEALFTPRKENVPGDADGNGTVEPGETVKQDVAHPETDENTLILGCQNYANVHSSYYAGAILGFNARGNATVTNCISYGKATTDKENIVGGFIVGYSEAALSASGNIDASGCRAKQVSDKITAYGVQSTAVNDDKFSVRFVSVIDTLEYTSVGFEVAVFYNSNTDLKGKTLTLEGQSVYSALKTGAGVNDVVVADSGKYFAALSVSNVPAAAANGEVRFIVTPFAKSNEGTLYGEAVVCVYSNGTLASMEYIR